MRAALLFAVLTSLGEAKSFADCDDCRATRHLIIFPNERAADPVFLAWKFKGTSGVDYARILRDPEYGEAMLAVHDPAIRNYLVDRTGRILAELPLEAGAGTYGAPGVSTGHRNCFFAQDRRRGFVVYGFGWKWHTAAVFVYKINRSQSSLSLTRIRGVDIDQVQRAYGNYLDQKFGSEYRAVKPLVMQFGLESFGDASCAQSICFTLRGDAYIPKAETGFANESDLQFAVTFDDPDRGRLRLINVVPRRGD